MLGVGLLPKYLLGKILEIIFNSKTGEWSNQGLDVGADFQDYGE